MSKLGIHSALECAAEVLQLVLLLRVILLVLDVYQSLLSRKLLVFSVGCCEMDDSDPDFKEPCKKKKKSTAV